MAAVWAARLKGTRGFTKTVAVKTMLPTISDNPHFEQMFLDEAQLASRIRHPNVVEIMDLGEQDDLLYLVMEWVDGEPLSAIRRIAAKREGIPRPIAVRIVQDAASGLHAAHELKDEQGSPIGLVHRDISPQNVLITFDGVVKIVDFGVAKAAGRTVEHTNSGQIKGKPPYMSPEQALGKEIDRRTDVFALGIILYQLTTGKHPFRGENDMITLQNIVSDRPIIPPRAYDKEYPKPLEAVVLKALDRDPEKRFQSAAELEASLDRVFPPTVPRVRPEDVGKFVTAMLGDRGEERRTALREAIRLADERSSSVDAAGTTGRFPELGTRVAPAPFGAPSNPDNARLSVTGLTQPTPHSGSFLRPSVPELTSSALSAPETPFGTQLPSEPPPRPKSRGALWVVGGLLIAGLLVGGALVLTKTMKDPDVGPAAPPPPTAAPTPAASVTAETPTEPSKGEKLDESGAIDLNQLAVEKGAQRGQGISGKLPEKDPKLPADPKDPKAKDPPDPKDTKDPKKPGPKPGGGFVPPPVTDPGF
jgi:serine/threonine-protein kinase